MSVVHRGVEPWRSVRRRVGLNATGTGRKQSDANRIAQWHYVAAVTIVGNGVINRARGKANGGRVRYRRSLRVPESQLSEMTLALSKLLRHS